MAKACRFFCCRSSWLDVFGHFQPFRDKIVGLEETGRRRSLQVNEDAQMGFCNHRLGWTGRCCRSDRGCRGGAWRLGSNASNSIEFSPVSCGRGHSNRGCGFGFAASHGLVSHGCFSSLGGVRTILWRPGVSRAERRAALSHGGADRRDVSDRWLGHGCPCGLDRPGTAITPGAQLTPVHESSIFRNLDLIFWTSGERQGKVVFKDIGCGFSKHGVYCRRRDCLQATYLDCGG